MPKKVVKKKKLSGRACRKKGHEFERWCAEKLREVFPDCSRHLEYQSAKAKMGIDLENTGHYLVQCKRGKRYASLSAMKQVKPKPGFFPVLITKGDNLEPIACIPFDHFIVLAKALDNSIKKVVRGELPVQNSLSKQMSEVKAFDRVKSIKAGRTVIKNKSTEDVLGF